MKKVHNCFKILLKGEQDRIINQFNLILRNGLKPDIRMIFSHNIRSPTKENL